MSLSKIDKLLRLYENNPDRAEAEAALKKAAQLMRNYIDDPESSIKQLKVKQEELRGKEERLDTICSGCGFEKPTHHKDCYSAKIQKRVGIGSTISCFGCAGIIVVFFAFFALRLFQAIFGA